MKQFGSDFEFFFQSEFARPKFDAEQEIIETAMARI